MKKSLRGLFLVSAVVVLILFFACLACVLCFGEGQEQEKFLKVQDAKLFLGGREFREIGFSKHDLFFQYLGLEEGPEAKRTAKKIIADLGNRGFRVVEAMLAPYYPADFVAYFFDDNPAAQEAKRVKFFAALDEFLDDCDGAGIKLVAALVANMKNIADTGHHSIHEGITNPDSLGYKRFEEFITATVARYKNRPAIAVWMIGYEYNLFADLQNPEGVFPGGPEGDIQHPGPVVRDARNNFNSAELRDFFKRVVAKIRSVDENHPINTGASEPRDCAMHLFRAAISGRPPDWADDTPQEREKYILASDPDADLLTIHWYLDNVDLGWYCRLARKIGKPLFISELGIKFKWVEGKIVGADYSQPESIGDLEGKLNTVVQEGAPLSLLWSYSEKSGPFQLFYGKTDEALEIIERANRQLLK
jgi:hypothetical protein